MRINCLNAAMWRPEKDEIVRLTPSLSSPEIERGKGVIDRRHNHDSATKQFAWHFSQDTVEDYFAVLFAQNQCNVAEWRRHIMTYHVFLV